MKMVLLGTGDAAGCPKMGCWCPACRDARKGGKSRRMRFSVLVHNEGKVALIDVSPDIRWQLI
jgi:phosphoribosyl 1,2-cyclic phosphate phosphodiesterase